jgi:hypothetical protein
VYAEVRVRTLCPGHGEAKALFGTGAAGRVLGAFVKSHTNIGAESDLNIHGVFGREEVAAAIQVRPEADAFIGDFAEGAEGEDLESAGVGEHCARPANEAVQAAEAADEFVAGAQVEVIGIAENDFRTEGFESVLGDGFDGAGSADGHEDRSLDSAVGEMELGAAAAGVCFREDLEG